jgi:hypothetical protein
MAEKAGASNALAKFCGCTFENAEPVDNVRLLKV